MESRKRKRVYMAYHSPDESETGTPMHDEGEEEEEEGVEKEGDDSPREQKRKKKGPSMGKEEAERLFASLPVEIWDLIGRGLHLDDIRRLDASMALDRLLYREQARQRFGLRELVTNPTLESGSCERVLPSKFFPMMRFDYLFMTPLGNMVYGSPLDGALTSVAVSHPDGTAKIYPIHALVGISRSRRVIPAMYLGGDAFSFMETVRSVDNPDESIILDRLHVIEFDVMKAHSVVSGGHLSSILTEEYIAHIVTLPPFFGERNPAGFHGCTLVDFGESLPSLELEIILVQHGVKSLLIDKIIGGEEYASGRPLYDHIISVATEPALSSNAPFDAMVKEASKEMGVTVDVESVSSKVGSFVQAYTRAKQLTMQRINSATVDKMYVAISWSGVHKKLNVGRVYKQEALYRSHIQRLDPVMGDFVAGKVVPLQGGVFIRRERQVWTVEGKKEVVGYRTFYRVHPDMRVVPWFTMREERREEASLIIGNRYLIHSTPRKEIVVDRGTGSWEVKRTIHLEVINLGDLLGRDRVDVKDPTVYHRYMDYYVPHVPRATIDTEIDVRLTERASLIRLIQYGSMLIMWVEVGRHEKDRLERPYVMLAYDLLSSRKLSQVEDTMLVNESSQHFNDILEVYLSSSRRAFATLHTTYYSM